PIAGDHIILDFFIRVAAWMRSRTTARRSPASSASESSIDWFWQTMQRRFFEMARARSSCTGSARRSAGSTSAKAGTTSAIKITSDAMRRRIVLLRRAGAQMGARSRRRTDTQPPVHERDQSAQRHEGAAEPDQRRKPVVIGAHHPFAIARLLAQHDIEIGNAVRANGGLGLFLPLGREAT